MVSSFNFEISSIGFLSKLSANIPKKRRSRRKVYCCVLRAQCVERKKESFAVVGSILAHNAENSEEYYFNWQDKKGAEEKKKRGKRWIVAVCSEEIEKKRNCISHFQPQKYKADSQQKRRRRRRKRRCLKLPRDKRERGKKMED